MKEVKLAVHDIEKTLDGQKILNQITFDVYDGEFLSIVGPSGCGKTTILRILIGLVKADSGSIEKEGVDITNMHSSNRGMGIVFQNHALFENMTVLENIEYALRIRKENKSAEARNRIRENALKLVEYMGLSEQIDKYPSSLSIGQQQRVAIARTLILEPDIILFDEPMSALDAVTKASLQKLLKELQREYKTTMIYITHDQEEALTLSDRVMVMDKADIVQIDTPENIMSNPANDYVKQFIVEKIQEKAKILSKYIR